MRPGSPFPLFRAIMQFCHSWNEENEIYEGQVTWSTYLFDRARTWTHCSRKEIKGNILLQNQEAISFENYLFEFYHWIARIISLSIAVIEHLLYPRHCCFLNYLLDEWQPTKAMWELCVCVCVHVYVHMRAPAHADGSVLSFGNQIIS